MAHRALDEQLAEVERIRGAGPSPETAVALRPLLARRNNYLAAKAADAARQLGAVELIPDLLAAFDRHFADPVKSDPQCWAKNAIAQALSALGHDDPEPYRRGLRHVQMEPVWGGQADTAGALRGHCAHALVECRGLSDLDLLGLLLEALVDPERPVRVEAARAIGRLDRKEAALVLRLRALVGDTEPEALGACLSGVLSIEGAEGIGFVRRFLDRGGEAAAEAALALGLMRDARAASALREKWEQVCDPALRDAILTALAASRQPESVDFLVGLVERKSPSAAQAIAALAGARPGGEIVSRLRAAVEACGSARLRSEFDERFRP